jgi:hypothetical protein
MDCIEFIHMHVLARFPVESENSRV